METQAKYTETFGVLPKDDIAELLQQKRGGFLIKSLNWWAPLQLRVWAFMAMIKGNFSFIEFCQLSLPSSFSDKSPLMNKLITFLCQELVRQHPTFIDCLNLFGHRLEGKNSYEAMLLVNEIITLDQYHAKQFLKTDSIVIDAGANIGVFSAFAANLAQRGHVYAFEPVEATFKTLQNNTKDYPQVSCIRSGLGKETSQKSIFVNPKSNLGSVFEDSPFYNERPDLKERESASIITLDAFVREHNIPRVDFIKIDTEGYEANILNGAKETIKNFKPVIAMSAYHNPNDKEDLPRILKEIYPDYICELYHDHEEDFVCYVKK